MRVAYRESINTNSEETLVIDKKIGGSSLYAELTLRVESTIGDYDMQSIQKQKFENEQAEENEDNYNDSFNLSAGVDETEEE